MTDATWAWLLALVSASLGYAVKWLSDLAQNRWTIARERETRAEARRGRRIDFQRETLLKLQEAAQKFGRATGKAHHLDTTAGRKLLPEDLDQEILQWQTQTALLSARVRDDKVRELATSFISRAVQVLHNPPNDDSMLLAALAVFQQLQDRIGEVIRTLDEDEAP